MKIAIVGSGSAAMHHVRAADKLKIACALITSRNDLTSVPIFRSIDHAESSFSPTHYIVANDTHLHEDTLVQIREQNSSVPILCEKPLMGNGKLESANQLWFGFNLRFNSEVKALRDALQHFNNKINHLSIEYGRDLRTWRTHPLRDNSYSKHSALGGGVLYDLCHEFDFLFFLFGSPTRLFANGGSFTKITEDAFDLFDILFESPYFDLGRVHLNCISTSPFRSIRLLAEDLYIEADLLRHTLQINDKLHSFSDTSTYTLQMETFVTDPAQLPDLKHALRIDEIVRAVEESNRSRMWQVI